MSFKMVIKDLLKYKRAKDIISKNRLELDLIVDSLLVLETIVKEQIDYIHINKKLPQEVIDKKKALKSSSKVESKLETKAMLKLLQLKKLNLLLRKLLSQKKKKKKKIKPKQTKI